MSQPNKTADHLANERTFLAWIRTSISIIVFGFVVARFGITLREFLRMQGNGERPATRGRRSVSQRRARYSKSCIRRDAAGEAAIAGAEDT